MDEIHDKILLLTGLGSGVLYLLKATNKKETNKYKNKEGKVVWGLFAFDFFVHVAMAMFGATLVYLSFGTSLLSEYSEYKIIGSIIGGLIARETIPIGLDLLVEEVNEYVETRRKTRKK
jgi:hypothetical protein